MAARVLALTVALLFAVHPAYADDTSPGAAALQRARDAWDKGSLQGAEPHYREALEKGGLAPAEVVEGYVRLGTIRAMLNKKESAVAAFRAASILDDKFTLPSEAGKRGATLAGRAKKDTAKIGGIKLSLSVPKGDLPVGKSFKVTATLDRPHVAIVNRIGLSAKDAAGKEITLDARPEESVEFEIASEAAVANSSILVRIDALDGRKNRLASVEERVKIEDKEKEAAPVAAASPTPATKSKSAAFTASSSQPVGADHGVRRGGFWSSPWPYLIGGIAVAGAAAAVYFGTRPVENVSVGSPGVQPQ